MTDIILCGASRGHYSKPIAYTQKPTNWVDEDTYEPIETPKKIRCEDSDHFDNLRIAKKKGQPQLHGNTASFPLKEMFIQRWVMTKKEMNEAVKSYDMFSLEMKPKIICKFCAENIKKND